MELSCAGSCQDAGGDGFGSPASATCPGGAALDCNGQNAGIFPGGLELPGNQTDENCDGSLGACNLMSV